MVPCALEESEKPCLEYKIEVHDMTLNGISYQVRRPVLVPSDNMCNVREIDGAYFAVLKRSLLCLVPFIFFSRM